MIRPFRLYSRSEIEAANDALAKTLDLWHQKWFPEGSDPPRIQVRDAALEHLSSEMEWRVVGGSGDLYFQAGDQLLNEVGRRLLVRGAAVPGANANRVVSALARLSIADCVRSFLQPQDDQTEFEVAILPSDMLGPGHGVLCLTVSFGNPALNVLTILLSIAVVERLLKRSSVATQSDSRRDALIARRQALEAANVRMHVTMEEESITLGELRGLVPGDVIVFDWPVDKALWVRTETGNAIGRCRLAQSEGMRAITLVGKAEKHRVI